MSHQPPIPLSVQEITPSWLSEILKVPVSPSTLILESNIQSGSGFLSNMARLSCSSGPKDFNLIIKFLPQTTELKNLIISKCFDKKEIIFYQKIAPDLIAIIPKLEHYLCKCYYAHIQIEDTPKNQPYASILVLEDLKPKGYYSVDFTKEETPEQIKESLEFLASFHAAATILEEKSGTKLPTLYNFVNSDKSGEIAAIRFSKIIEFLSESNSSPEIISSYSKLQKYSCQILNAIEAAGEQFACIIHNDLWPNNLLFKGSKIKAIDWQLLAYKDPLFDVAVAIISNLPMDQLKEEAVLSYFEYYYEHFVAECGKLNCPQLLKRGHEDFVDFFKTWGLAYALMWFVNPFASNPFASNIPRLVKTLEFLVKEMKVADFLLEQVA